MTTQTTTPSLPRSTWALLTERTITWRQACEGSVVLGVVGVSAVAAVAALRIGRLLLGSRSSAPR